MNSAAGAIFICGRSVFFRRAGTALRIASRTARRCTPSLRATPWIVPAPNSYSSRICSNNYPPWLSSPTSASRSKLTLTSRVEVCCVQGWAKKTNCRSGPLHNAKITLFRLDARLRIPAWNPRMTAFVDTAHGRLQIIEFVTDGYEVWFIACIPIWRFVNSIRRRRTALIGTPIVFRDNRQSTPNRLRCNSTFCDFLRHHLFLRSSRDHQSNQRVLHSPAPRNPTFTLGSPQKLPRLSVIGWFACPELTAQMSATFSPSRYSFSLGILELNSAHLCEWRGTDQSQV